MEKYLNKKSELIKFEHIYLDPNNPRLGTDRDVDYSDASSLFDPDRQAEIQEILEDVYKPEELIESILSQGWMPIDNVIVWKHPDHDGAIVVEGNTRILSLRIIREKLVQETKKLDRMTSGGTKRYAKHDIDSQQAKVNQIKTIIQDTDNLQVVTLNASSGLEVEEKLTRLLAVRHINGAKKWSNYAQDLWLLNRYTDLFDKKFPDSDLRWEQEIINQVSSEASISPTQTKRKLLATSCFSHFRAEFEDSLPEGEEFKPTDYYCFELLVQKPFVRKQFQLDGLHLDSEMEKVIFDWIFKHPRGSSAEDNENIFYRHENFAVWDKMSRYDDKHGTNFAMRFNVTDPENTPKMREVEADYLSHMNRSKPQDVLDKLINTLNAVPAESLRTEGEFFKEQLKMLQDQSQRFLDMIEAAEDRNN
jgi:hypothetical protein